MALMSASGINVPGPSDLTAAFQNVGNQGLGNINSIYANANAQGTADAIARQQSGQGSYNASRLGQVGALAPGNLEAGMGGVLGNTLYQNALGNEQYQQQGQLANQIGSLMRPSTLQQVFQGIGAIGRPAAQLAGMYGGSGGPSGGTAGAGSPLGLEGGYGGNYGSNWGYGSPAYSNPWLQPNMLNNYGGGQ